MFVTGTRVAELCNLQCRDIDLDASTIRINEGKCNKDRIALIPTSLILTLRLHLESHKDRKYVFETNRCGKFSSRWVQILARMYGLRAGIDEMHPHRLRHTILTRLAAGVTQANGERKSGMSDAQLQVISGHSQRSSLEVYTRLALSHVSDHYQVLMQDD